MRPWRNLNVLTFFSGRTDKNHEKYSIGVADAAVDIITQVKDLTV